MTITLLSCLCSSSLILHLIQHLFCSGAGDHWIRNYPEMPIIVSVVFIIVCYETWILFIAFWCHMIYVLFCRLYFRVLSHFAWLTESVYRYVILLIYLQCMCIVYSIKFVQFSCCFFFLFHLLHLIKIYCRIQLMWLLLLLFFL